MTSIGNAERFTKSFTVVSNCHCVASVTKSFTLKGVQTIRCCRCQHWIVCKLLINVFVTLVTQQHFKYHCKALFETSCIFYARCYMCLVLCKVPVSMNVKGVRVTLALNFLLYFDVTADFPIRLLIRVP
jgi:hypothetical protein